jgi:hypothetical protein
LGDVDCRHHSRAREIACPILSKKLPNPCVAEYGIVAFAGIFRILFLGQVYRSRDPLATPLSRVNKSWIADDFGPGPRDQTRWGPAMTEASIVIPTSQQPILQG